MKKYALLFLFFAAVAQAQSGYHLKINLKNCKDTLVYLTFYQFDKTLIKDTCTHIKNGKIEFKGAGKLDRGIYSIVGQQKSILFDFFIDEETQFLELKSDADFLYAKDIEALNSKRENDFFNYIRFIGDQNREIESTKQAARGRIKKDSTELVSTKQKAIAAAISTYEEHFLEQNKGSYVAAVLNLKRDKLLKDIPKASNGRPDSIAVYRYFKKHYWDGVDFQDDGMLRNPFFATKLNTYLDNVVVRHPDSVSVELDRILQKMKPETTFYKMLLGHFIYTYETSKIMGFDQVFVHLADTYFKTGKAKGIYEDETVVDKIVERSNKMKPLLLGAVAPNLYMIKPESHPQIGPMGFDKATTSEELTTLYYAHQAQLEKLYVKLHDIQADYLILLFWDVDCGHCQTEVPKILDEYHQFLKDKKDVKVYSVYTQYDYEKYVKYIAEHKLDWINLYDPVHLNNIREKYDVYSTPVIYILDKNKVIKAKKIGSEQIKDIIRNMEAEYKSAKK
jgi:alkyl hydroperoxide reductase subunit AhpC